VVDGGTTRSIFLIDIDEALRDSVSLVCSYTPDYCGMKELVLTDAQGLVVAWPPEIVYFSFGKVLTVQYANIPAGTVYKLRARL
jgi:hypothetical protein